MPRRLAPIVTVWICACVSAPPARPVTAVDDPASEHGPATVFEAPPNVLEGDLPLPGEGQPAAKTGASYTCRMHPEVRMAAPGRCPRCDMELVPGD